MSGFDPSSLSGTEVAIIGMSGRFPGAADLTEYWDNVRAGRECIAPRTDDELRAAGVSETDLADPHYVRATGMLGEMDGFDAGFFGYSPKDAAILDPQHRHFHECCWEALEQAGRPPRSFDGSIGLFGGCGMNSYFISNILTNPDLVKSVGLFLLRHTGNDRDFMPTSVSYKLNLRGPSVAVQTACSTSLVATHIACQSLLSGECDIALAGGVTIITPHGQGYHYAPNEVQSPDGHCRPFDAKGAGTVLTSGVGVVALRRLADAIEDGDPILAVIRGSAINNDGAGKVGYLAPSVDGHARAVIEALAVAGLSADDISYIEAHGTGTLVGDPIEIAALTQAFRKSSTRKRFCRIGSVKANIGHLDTAAGVASLIKVVEALRRKELPPSINFETPNPAADWENSPFVVNTSLTTWASAQGPRRAGVSSLGVGGTNAHVVVEEAPELPPTDPAKPWEVLTLSAKTARALDRAAERLADHLRSNPGVNLGDVAHTLQVGREGFEHRRSVAVKDAQDAVGALTSKDAKRIASNRVRRAAPSVVFMFPGGGSQYPGMGREIYENEPVFRAGVDRCLAILKPLLDFELRALLLPDNPADPEVGARLARPCASVCAVFVIEHALAKLWMSWGVTPEAMTGHSLGEYTAACLAGVMSLEDALRIVALRGRLVERAPDAAMVSVQLPEAALRERLNGDLDLAVVNSPSLCVVAGVSDRLAAFEQALAADDVECKRLRLTGASHSRFIEPILAEFRAELSRIRLSPPTIPYVSNVTGAWVRPEDATNPDYWARHFRNTVRFSQGVAELLREEGRALLEVGPGQTLSSLARQQPTKAHAVISSMRHPDDPAPDGRALMSALGALWAAGAPIDWAKVRGAQRRRRIPLPTYAWDHERYWIEPGRLTAPPPDEALAPLKKAATLDEWFAVPVWKERPLDLADAKKPAEGATLVFVDKSGLGAEAARRLRETGEAVVCVREGDAFFRMKEDEYALSPEAGREGYDALFAELASTGRLPARILHCWMVTPDESYRPGSSFFHRNQERGFYSLLFLAQAIGGLDARPNTHIVVASSDMQSVRGEGSRYPEKATLLGPARVMPREYPGVTVKSVDLPMSELAPRRAHKGEGAPVVTLAGRLIDELRDARSAMLAFRGAQRFEQAIESAPLGAPAGRPPALRDRGVYLITGGLGGIGLSIAEHLAKTVRARLILLGRSALPARDEWDRHLRANASRDRTSERIRAVRALEALGAEVLPASGDVASFDQMQSVVSEARRRFGAIQGVIHAAGDIDDGVMQAKTPESCERVFTPKVHGTLLLASLLRDAGLDFFALFSSSSALTGPAGQADYAGANAFLDAFAESRLAPKGARTVAINWGVWKGVGMASPISRRLRGEEDHSGAIVTGRPLLHERVSTDGAETVYTTPLAVAERWILDEHRVKPGNALLPGTGYLEIARSVAEETFGAAPCEIRDLSFLSPLAVRDDEPREMRVTVHREALGVAFEVESRAVGAGPRAEWSLHAQGALRPIDAPEPARLDLAEIAARCAGRVERAGGDALETKQFKFVNFGPRWRSLRETRFGEREALARLELAPEFHADLADWRIHPALLDIATGFALPLVPGYEGAETLYVPLSYHRARIHRPLPARIFSRVTSDEKNEASREIAVFDVTITDEHGAVVMEVERFAVRRIDAAHAFAAPAGSRAESSGSVAGAGAADASHLSPGERLFLETYEAGIEAEEGAEAFVRALGATGSPRIVASPVDLCAIVKKMDALGAQPAQSGVKFTRPTLDSEFEAPRDELERALAAWWEDLLGVDKIGVHDNFFDLGGHSLIAVRLFAKIKKAYSVEYPISVLFEAPTIAGCADLLRRELGDAAAPATPCADATGAGTLASARRRFLVPMRIVKDAKKPPFYLVAGMFGNVLNLRHLASHLGDDQPVYAIQARGLYGDDKPHTSFEDMARDYLAEIRQVQPHGPYFLGGFSGGGNTAFEMAQQLRHAGEPVGVVVLLDSRPAEMPALTPGDKVIIHAQRIARMGPRYFTEWARKRWAWEMKKRHARANPIPKDLTPAEFRSKEIERAFYESLGRYRTSVFPGDVHLFRPPLMITHRLPGGRVTTKDRLFLDPSNHWKPFVGGALHVHEVTGDHDSMVLEPHVRGMASKLRSILADAQRRATEAKPSTSDTPRAEAGPLRAPTDPSPALQTT